MSELTPLWKKLKQRYQSTAFDEEFFRDFRSPEKQDFANFSSWSPLDNDYRYFLTFLQNLARGKSTEWLSLYSQIGNTMIGNPLRVKVKGNEVNLDYFIALEEFSFVSNHINTEELITVAEIGAGYGRLAQTYLKLLPSIQEYYVIDLPETWSILRGYLQIACPDIVEKITFIDYRNQDKWGTLRPSLTINTDGFHAMRKDVINNYKLNLLSNSKYVYLKNAVCKYLPSTIGVKTEVGHLQSIFQSGYMNEIGDIFDDSDLEKFQQIYVQRYSPNEHFRCVMSELSESFSLFCHVLYGKESEGDTFS